MYGNIIFYGGRRGRGRLDGAASGTPPPKKFTGSKYNKYKSNKNNVN